MIPPKIDMRTTQDLIQKMKEMVPYYTPEWRFSVDEPDPGVVLFLIFSEMFQENIKRFNQVPYKQFIAFLNTMDVSLLPSQSAYAYLTFKLSNGAEEPVFIPAGTQVSANVITEEEAEEVFFETDRNMLITPAQLQTVFITDGRLDRVIAVPEESLTESRERLPQPVTLFDTDQGENLQEHALYLAHPYLFNLKSTAQVEVSLYNSNLKYEEPALLAAFADQSLVEWLYWQEDEWIPFDEVLTQDQRLYLRKNKMGQMTEHTLDDVEGRWIKCRVKQGAIHRLLEKAEEFAVDEIMVKTDYYDPSDKGGIDPDKIFMDDTEQDKGGFYPFGEFFAPYSTFYIASEEVFCKKEGKISLQFDLKVKHNLMKTAEDPDIDWKLIMKEKDVRKKDPPFLSITQVIWEYWDGYSWALLTPDPAYEKLFYKPKEGRRTVQFECPADIEETYVNGQLNYWIRARVVHMDQMTAANVIYLSPWIENLKLTYTYEQKRLYPAHCLTRNNLEFQDQTDHTRGQAAPFYPFAALDNLDPSLYIAFDKAPKKGPICLYLSLERQYFTEQSTPTIEWQYLRRRGTKVEWAELKMLDQTGQIGHSGMLQFVGPDDFARHSQFNQSQFWIRAVNRSSGKTALPVMKGIYLNTVRAVQQETINNEFPDPEYSDLHWEYVLAHSPVLSAEVWVDETGHLTEEELEELQQSHDMKLLRDSEGNLQRCWVKWKEVNNFLASGMDDRVYVLNAAAGRIRFGDGKNGKIPPNQGSEYVNVKYSVGGGNKGNVSRYDITNLQNALAYVQTVYNPEPAVGGADMETMAEAVKRGPQIFKHKYRAVTAEDFEWLARQKFQQISKVKSLSNVNARLEKEPGAVTLVVLPKGNQPNDDLFVELKPQLEQYLMERAAGVIAFPEKIHVIEPAYLEISVNVTLIVDHLDAVHPTEELAKRKIDQFLNPYTGHYDGQGWEIGEDIHPSLFYSLLKSIDAVHHVEKLFLHVVKIENGKREEVDADQLSALKHGMIQNGRHKIVVGVL